MPSCFSQHLPEPWLSPFGYVVTSVLDVSVKTAEKSVPVSLVAVMAPIGVVH